MNYIYGVNNRYWYITQLLVNILQYPHWSNSDYMEFIGKHRVGYIYIYIRLISHQITTSHGQSTIYGTQKKMLSVAGHGCFTFIAKISFRLYCVSKVEHSKS